MRRIIALGFSTLPLAAAAFGGALWLAETFAPVRNAASVEMMQVLHDEHALVAEIVKMDSEAKRRAYATADQEAAALKLAALEQSRMRVAEAERETRAETVAKTERKVAAARAPVRAEQVAAVAPIAGPLPLVQMANASAPAPAEGPVRSRLRSLVSDVRRIPSWLQSAAGWVADAVPAPKLPALPSLPRQFNATI
jgi:hypothetical protein